MRNKEPHGLTGIVLALLIAITVMITPACNESQNDEVRHARIE